MQKIIFKSERDLLSFFRKFKGKNLYELKNLLDGEIETKISLNKGMVGQIFEGLTGRPPNSSKFPDIKELGVELKAIPFRRLKNNSLSSKERSKLKSINYKTLLHETWKESLLRKKINKILFIVYEHPPGYRFNELEHLKYVGSFLFDLNTREEKNQIENDWQKLKNEVCSFRAHKLTEPMFKFLSASCG